MIKYVKDNFCFILLGLIVAGILVNSILHGIDLIVTQHMIDETYRITK